MLEYALYFLIGGGIVSVVVWLARQGHPFLSGMALVFPSVTLVSMYFIGKTAGDEAVAASARSAISSTFIVWLPYITTVAYLSPRVGVNRALAVGLALFLILVFLWIYLNQIRCSLQL
jgi:uncharacterized membrane protein (GlpM family)